MRLGVDLSTYREVLTKNKSFYLDGKEVNPLDVFRKNGVSLARIRLWNDPYDENSKPYLGGTCDLKNFIELAKMQQSRGYEIVLCLHYSDFWADPGKQYLPKAWRTVAPCLLAKKLYRYTLKTLRKIKKEGINIAFVQIGNEITNGMLWPHGKLDGVDGRVRRGYGFLSKLLKEGIKATSKAFPHAKTIIHLERSHDNAVYREFFTNIISEGVPFDIIGMSYYPYWHGTFEQLSYNIKDMQNTFHKDIMIMETGYGFTMDDYLKTLDKNDRAQLVINDEFIKNMNNKLPYPLSEEGQASFVEHILTLAQSLDVKAVFYWEPCWLPGDGICWASPEGQAYINEIGKETRNEWANQCLFDYRGHALKGLSKFTLAEEEK